MNKLEEVLDDIHYSRSDVPSEIKLQEQVEKQLPDYKIKMWDMDDWNSNLTGSVVEYIADEVKKGKQEILCAEWCAYDCSVFYAFVAVK